MKLVLQSEKEMMDFGEKLARILLEKGKNALELIGDVGSGKTTITRGLAAGLGVETAVTSPSFTISKQYAFPAQGERKAGVLVHYDFYRLGDPGIMQEDLAESLAEENNVVVIEWGESVSDLLPEERAVVRVKILDDGSREIETEGV